MTVELCESDLFLIEMALDQALYTISDINSPIYKKFELIDQKIFSLRKSVEKSESVCEDNKISILSTLQGGR